MKPKYFIIEDNPKVSPGYHIVDTASTLDAAYALLLREYDLSHLVVKAIEVQAKEK